MRNKWRLLISLMKNTLIPSWTIKSILCIMTSSTKSTKKKRKKSTLLITPQRSLRNLCLEPKKIRLGPWVSPKMLIQELTLETYDSSFKKISAKVTSRMEMSQRWRWFSQSSMIQVKTKGAKKKEWSILTRNQEYKNPSWKSLKIKLYRRTNRKM